MHYSDKDDSVVFDVAWVWGLDGGLLGLCNISARMSLHNYPPNLMAGGSKEVVQRVNELKTGSAIKKQSTFN